MDLSCNNAIVTFGLLAICAHVICLRKGMKIKLQILTENTETLPDENEMSVLTDCFKRHATYTSRSVIGNYYHRSTYVVVANKGLHPTKFTNPPTVQNQKLYYSEFIKYYLLSTFYSFHFSLF